MFKNILKKNYFTNLKRLREESKVDIINNMNSQLYLKSNNKIISHLPKIKNFYFRSYFKNFSTKNNLAKNNTNNKKISKWKSLKQKIKTYGLFGLYFYIFSYIATFGFFYLLTKLKIINSDKFFFKAQEWGLEKYVDIKGIRDYIGPKYADLVVAVIINEVCEVIRLPLVVALLPKLVKKFKK